jgi:hypothetical protein
VTLAKDSSFGIGESNPEHSSISKFQAERDPDPVPGIIAAEFDHALNSVKPRNRQTRAFHHALETADAISHFAKRQAIHRQLSHSRTLFDQLHHDYFFFGGYSLNSFLMSLGSLSEIFDGLLSSSR